VVDEARLAVPHPDGDLEGVVPLRDPEGRGGVPEFVEHGDVGSGDGHLDYPGGAAASGFLDHWSEAVGERRGDGGAPDAGRPVVGVPEATTGPCEHRRVGAVVT